MRFRAVMQARYRWDRKKLRTEDKIVPIWICDSYVYRITVLLISDHTMALLYEYSWEITIYIVVTVNLYIKWSKAGVGGYETMTKIWIDIIALSIHKDSQHCGISLFIPLLYVKCNKIFRIMLFLMPHWSSLGHRLVDYRSAT